MLIIGHRGDREKYADNTIEGIGSAFERGADGVEFDVYYRPEKGVYLIHPYLHDLSKDYPTLEEVLLKFGNKGRLQIEIKSLEKECVDEVAKLVERYKVTNLELSSSVYPLLPYVREVFPRADVQLIGYRLVEEWWTEDFGNYFLMKYLELTRANVISIGKPENFWNKNRVEMFHKNGFKVESHLYTDTKEEYENLLEAGVNASTADKLEVLKWRK
jgi:glycerophosphoryl diester phosphodiesterase